MDPGVVHAERAITSTDMLREMAFIMAVSTRCLNSSSVARTSTGRRARAFYILNSQDRRVCGAKVKGRDFDQASGPDPWSRDATEAGIAVEGAWIARQPPVGREQSPPVGFAWSKYCHGLTNAYVTGYYLVHPD